MSVERLTKVVKAFKDARDLLEDKDHWIRGRYAADSKGRMVAVTSEKACKFCSVGAVCRVSEAELSGWHDPDSFTGTIAKYLTCAMGGSSSFFDTAVINANDRSTTKHQHVLMSYDFAVLMAQDDLKAARKAEKKQ